MSARDAVERKQRAVLMVAGGYPPDPQYPLRTALFAKYLPRFGWHPVILAPRGRTDVEPVEGTPVYRAFRPPSATVVWRSLRRRGTTGNLAESRGGVALAGRARALRTIALWLETPDTLTAWIPFAVLRGWAVARRRDVRVIHASGPPFSVVLAGVLIARLSGRPLVADFRDAWVLDASDPFGALHGGFHAPFSERRIQLLRRLERESIRAAGAVLFTSSSTMQGYLSLYPGLDARAHLIFNGFDPEDFADDERLLEPPTISHVGTVHDYQWEQARLVLQGFQRALASGRLAKDARLCFVGPFGEVLGRQFDAIVAELALGDRVSRMGAVSHVDAVRWIRGSRLLLLLAGENRYVRLSKISECLAAKRPLLTLAARDSETARSVAAHGGRVLHEPTVEEVVDGLATGFWAGAQPVAAGSQPMMDPHPLNRVTEAAQLATVLDCLAGAPPPGDR